jgi:hypothetical protein
MFQLYPASSPRHSCRLVETLQDIS